MRHRDVLCVILFFAYCWAGIDLRLVQHAQGAVFSTLPGFLGDFWKHAGGPGDGLYRLIAQAYAFRTWGAVAFTLQVVAAAVLVETCFRTLAGRPLPLVRFVPAAAVLAQPDFYNKPTLLQPGILAALALAALLALAQRRWRGVTARVAAALPMLAAAYWAGGLAAAAVFAAGALASLLWRPGREAPAAKPARARRRFRLVPPTWAQTALLLVCLGGAIAGSYWSNGPARRVLAIYYYAYNRQWDAALATVPSLGTKDFNPLVQYQINLALHETGRLGDEMFRYPQPGPMLLQFSASRFLPYTLALADMCIRLGRPNEAEVYASDAVVDAEFDPRLRREMVEASLVKRDRGVARKLLTMLSYDFTSGAWAREQLTALRRDPESAGDPELGLFRRRMERTDDMVQVWQRAGGPTPDTDRMLLDQLEQDPGNRMAFEFLMGDYLLRRDLNGARALMPRIKDMTGPAYAGPNGVRRTPRHYQEAMAMYEGLSGQRTEFEGFEIQPETVERLETFKSIVRQFPSRERAMEAAWVFRDSYFFYAVFGPGDYR